MDAGVAFFRLTRGISRGYHQKTFSQVPVFGSNDAGGFLVGGGAADPATVTVGTLRDGQLTPTVGGTVVTMRARRDSNQSIIIGD